MIAIDSSVLIDIIGGDTGADAAVEAVEEAMARGPVVVCDVVLSEVVAGLGQSAVVVERLEETGIEYLPLEQRAAARAGEMQRRYHERGGARERTVPDFMIGAHALLQCQALITRDAAFFRDYFKGLKVIVPKAS
jgi:predicted nucleic acid-binding protein